jgi:hypothetical protein
LWKAAPPGGTLKACCAEDAQFVSAGFVELGVAVVWALELRAGSAREAFWLALDSFRRAFLNTDGVCILEVGGVQEFKGVDVVELCFVPKVEDCGSVVSFVDHPAVVAKGVEAIENLVRVAFVECLVSDPAHAAPEYNEEDEANEIGAATARGDHSLLSENIHFASRCNQKEKIGW